MAAECVCYFRNGSGRGQDRSPEHDVFRFEGMDQPVGSSRLRVLRFTLLYYYFTLPTAVYTPLCEEPDGRSGPAILWSDRPPQSSPCCHSTQRCRVTDRVALHEIKARYGHAAFCTYCTVPYRSPSSCIVHERCVHVVTCH